MKTCFILLLIQLASFSSFTQVDTEKTPVNSRFKLHVDSIERKITVNKWGTDSTYLLYYTVTNLSADTLIYITNSCFYYNHFSLQVGKLEFDINPEGGCVANAMTPHSIAPGESFHKTEWITAANLHLLTKGEWTAVLSIPLVNHEEKTYRIDGRSFVKNSEPLTAVSQTKIVETIINNKKRKKSNT
jgi:hypothetical protein